MNTCLRAALLVLPLLLLSACNGVTQETIPPANTEAGDLPTSAPTATTAAAPTTVDNPTSTATLTPDPPATPLPATPLPATPLPATPLPATPLPATRTPVPPDTMVDINALEDFTTFFDDDATRTRLILVLSTSCSSCLAGARWLEESVLAADAGADVQVYAVWFPMVPPNILPSELSGQRDESVLDDLRVIHFWDRQRLVNEWLAGHAPLEGPKRSSLRRTYGDLNWGTYVWDAYYVYEPGTTWEAAASPVASGYPLLQNREEIRSALGVSPVAAGNVADPAATTYRISPSESFVSYGVHETFAGRDLNYAIGVTSHITGEIVLDHDNLAQSHVGPIVVNIHDFSSDNFLRDDRIRNEFLESNRYPLATFTPTAIRGLPEAYTPGETVEFEMDGDLEVRDAVVPTTFTVNARLDNGRLTGTASGQILMTDFGFDPPAVANLIAAENEVDVTFEFVAVPES